MMCSDSRVTVHMAASLDGFIARRDGTVDWMETSDHYAAGADLTPAQIETFLASIDCHVMGSRTYETAYGFDTRGLGWAYGDKPCVVLTSRSLPSNRSNVQFHTGDLEALFTDRLRPRFRNIWVAGGAHLAGECLRRGIADELVHTILPVLIGSGIPFFGFLPQDIPLHLVSSCAYRNGAVELRYSLRR